MKDFNILANPFDNFKLVLEAKSFRLSVMNTLKIWILNFIPQLGLALVLTGWFTSRHYRLRAQGIFKVLFYMPNIITAATIAILFNQIMQYPVGAMNSLLLSLGFIKEPISFLVKVGPSVGTIAFIQFWMWYGYTMLILISGVLGMNTELFEAAEVDGASDLQTFLLIVMPNLRTIMVYTLVTSIIGGLQMFDIPRLFNQGKPGDATLTASMYIFNQAFSGSFFFNRAAAASMVIFAVIAVLSSIVFHIMRDREEEKIKKYQKRMKKARRAYR